MEKKLDTFEKIGVWRDVLSTKGGLPVTLYVSLFINSRLRVTDVYLNGTAFGRLETCQKKEFTISQMS